MFAAADIGVSGVNLAVAETGTLCVVENEGNVRLVSALPRIHVAVMGMERVVADWDEAAHILQILPMAAIGDDAAGYVNLITGPRRQDEADGPEELHLRDPRRRPLGAAGHRRGGGARLHPLRRLPLLLPDVAQRRRPGLRVALLGADRGGVTPLLEGMRGERSSELPFLSSLCGSCHEACPVGIPLHDLLVRVRGRATTAAHRRDRLALPAAGAAHGARRSVTAPPHRRRGWACGCSAAAAGCAACPAPGGDWTSQRDLPTRWPPR